MKNTSLEKIPLCAFRDNYIWLISNGKHVIIIDPGLAQPVLEYMAQHSLSPIAVLLTHHHADHTGGVTEITAQYSVPVYGPAKEKITGVTALLQEGDEIYFRELALTAQILDVPGHTQGHIAYCIYEQKEQNQAFAALGPAALFCGDTLFSTGCGRLFEGTAEQMLLSLEKLAALPSDTQVYCAHEYTLSNIAFALACEPENTALLAWQKKAQELRQAGRPTLPTTLRHELTVNPFLRCHKPAVRAAAEAYAGHALLNTVDVFTKLRPWKNIF